MNILLELHPNLHVILSTNFVDYDFADYLREFYLNEIKNHVKTS